MRTEPNAKKNSSSAITCNVPWHVTKVKALQNYKLEVEFLDGAHGFVEMQSKIMSPEAGIFTKLKNQAIFNQVYLEYGAVTWPGEIDLAPDAMYDEIKAHGVWCLK